MSALTNEFALWEMTVKWAKLDEGKWLGRIVKNLIGHDLSHLIYVFACDIVGEVFLVQYNTSPLEPLYNVRRLWLHWQ